jgi:hypothetical protein
MLQIVAKLQESLTEDGKKAVNPFASRLKPISEFLSDAVEAFKDIDLPSAIEKVAPWAGLVTDTVSEVAPPLKFAVKLLEKLTKEEDPVALGELACTLAYERAAEQAIIAAGSPRGSRPAAADVKRNLKEVDISELTFNGFTFRGALAHPFVKRADATTNFYLHLAGYTEDECKRVERDIHGRFIPCLKALLSHGSTKDKFAPFTQLMELGGEESQSYAALLEHAQYVRRLFEEDRVFGKEDFSLAEVYTETECGKLLWNQITGAQGGVRFDPFSEASAPRLDITEAVLGLIGDPSFRDAIIIQGSAGAGKSSFCLKLSTRLLDCGLRPIYIRLRDVRLDIHAAKALPLAVKFGEEGSSYTRPDDLFLGGAIFNESTEFRSGRICPYVLILDGWDEISISASEGFRARVARLLDQVRSEYLRNRDIPIRVILTGRPSEAVADSTFLQDKTPILTIRPFHPKRLEEFITKVSTKLKRDLKDRFRSMLERYQKDFAAMLKDPNNKQAVRNMEVLGLPLLAYLVVRLIAEWKGGSSQLADDPTTLYRNLLDLTCGQSGKAAHDISGTQGQARITGQDLRVLLQQTASAITAYGTENIPYRELALRLERIGCELSLDLQTSRIEQDNLFTTLIISFYFKGGRLDQGCEFMHKSFREYLYAEHIIEILKKFGRLTRGQLQERDAEAYWEDFRESDSRRTFSRELCGVIAPQWLTPEVSRHIEKLLMWEIGRGDSSEQTVGVVPTTGLSTEGWEKIRDGLADLWDWWADGTHLRPQPKRKRGSTTIDSEPPFVSELIEISSRLDTEEGRKVPIPVRSVAIDAHLGDALFLLCNHVHFRVAVNSGWIVTAERTKEFGFDLRVVGIETIPDPTKLWAGVSAERRGPRRYQSEVRRDGRSWTLFAPSGPNAKFFGNFCHRINADGWRPGSPFPLNSALLGLDLRSTLLEISIRERIGTFLYVNLSQAQFVGTISCLFIFVLADNLRITKSNLWGSRFFGSVLSSANFTDTLQKSFYIDEFTHTDGIIGLDAKVEERRAAAQSAEPEPNYSPE